MQPQAIMLAALASLAAVAPAHGHVVFDRDHAQAGSYYAGMLRVSHGCGTSPTRSVRVEIPAAIVSAKPQPKAGWTVRIEKQPLETPVAGEGGSTITERVAAIVWTGDLPADQFEQFGLMLKLPDGAGPLYFPTRQSCAEGENAWVNIPEAPEKWHDTPSPAPMLILDGGSHTGHGM